MGRYARRVLQAAPNAGFAMTSLAAGLFAPREIRKAPITSPVLQMRIKDGILVPVQTIHAATLGSANLIALPPFPAVDGVRRPASVSLPRLLRPSAREQGTSGTRLAIQMLVQ